VCDTTFVSVRLAAAAHPERFAHWPEAAVTRLNTAILAISFATRAEIRLWAITARWQAPRWARTQKVLESYLAFGVDSEVEERWAELAAQRRRGGWAADDNDLWIAATALTRNLPLVACDRDFGPIEGLDLIYLPRKPDSRPLTP
jgi:predicted nucleic acid-binding protein